AYRTVTYYFDDTVAKVVEAPAPSIPLAPSIPEIASREVGETQISEISYVEGADSSAEISEIPPPLTLAKAPEPAPPPPPTTTQAMQLYETGRNCFDAGDVKGAIDSYLLSI